MTPNLPFRHIGSREIDAGRSGVVCEIIESHGYQKASLIGILQDIQAKMNYLPRKALIQVAKSLDIPLTAFTKWPLSIRPSASNPREDTPSRYAWEQHAMCEEEPEFLTILRIDWR